MDVSVASISAGEGVRPYKIHVSSKYLDLTRKKLELTRLPHEILLPRAQEWSQGTPKSQVEPLIDFWLENYNWRNRESYFNASYTQFRAAIRLPNSPVPTRLHFIHIESPHPQAVPLLLIPSFPLTNLSLSPLFKPLSDPENPRDQQPFHLIIPSLPGLGFSDAIPSPPSSPVTANVSSASSSFPHTPSLLDTTAGLLNTLMQSLHLPHYLVSATGSGSISPAHIDYHLPRLLAANHSKNCVGIHIIDPPIGEPTLVQAPWGWFKFVTARFFHAGVWGYTREDWDAAVNAKRRQHRHRRSLFSSSSSTSSTNRQSDLEANLPTDAVTPLLPQHHSLTAYPSTALPLGLSLHSPNTFAYSLCDSPVGLLSLVLHTLRRVSPFHTFTKTQIIDFTTLAWLPGPEGVMRFWSGASASEALEKDKVRWSGTCTSVTVFGNGSDDENIDNRGFETGFSCPTWSSTYHRVVYSARHSGLGGLIAWERPEAIVEGCRGLAEVVIKKFPELFLGGDEDDDDLREVFVTSEREDVIPEESEPVDIQVETPGAIEVEVEADSPDTVILSPGAEEIR